MCLQASFVSASAVLTMHSHSTTVPPCCQTVSMCTHARTFLPPSLFVEQCTHCLECADDLGQHGHGPRHVEAPWCARYLLCHWHLCQTAPTLAASHSPRRPHFGQVTPPRCPQLPAPSSLPTAPDMNVDSGSLLVSHAATHTTTWTCPRWRLMESAHSSCWLTMSFVKQPASAHATCGHRMAQCQSRLRLSLQAWAIASSTGT